MSIGVFKNGLGSLRNLHGLLASIKVGHRELGGAVGALGGDCESLQNALQGVSALLSARGVSAQCNAVLAASAQAAIERLEEALRNSSGRSRLTVGLRLRLEPVVGQTATTLEEILPLLEALSLACAPRAAAPALTQMVHEGVSWARTPTLGYLQPVYLVLPAGTGGLDLGVDLQTARSLVSLGISMVAERAQAVKVCVSNSAENGLVTQIIGSGGAVTGSCIQWGAYTRSPATLACAEELSRLLGVVHHYEPSGQRLELSWPT